MTATLALCSARRIVSLSRLWPGSGESGAALAGQSVVAEFVHRYPTAGIPILLSSPKGGVKKVHGLIGIN